MIGTTLSHYKITAELGRGGMGIVYKAEDTKLDRTVAIKVLPSSALAGEDDRTRFYREAKAAAQLHHPHIAGIFEIDEAVPSDAPHGTEPSPFIAMEFIDGEPLSARIATGPLKLDEAVRIATQIAHALEAAHDKNIVHRDIKSANVMLTKKGDAKVLDFGLAKTAQSTMLTRMGSTLGTVAYMSPEQARGEEVDHRTDLWALGVVLYEMIAGTNPFSGEYEQAVVYSILNADPEPLTALRTGVPMELERIVNKLLAKEAGRRYASTKDLIVDLQSLDLEGSGISTVSRATTPIRRTTERPNGRLWWGVAVLALLAGAFLGWMAKPDKKSDQKRTILFDAGIGPNEINSPPIISPDGTMLLVVTEGLSADTLTIRSMDRLELSRITVSEKLVGFPAFSPDSRWLAIPTRQGLKRFPTAGGAAEVLSDSLMPNYVTWIDNSTVLVGGFDDVQFYTVAGIGESPRVVDPGETHFILQPHIIAGTDILLYYSMRDPDRYQRGSLMAYNLASGKRVEIARNGMWGRYHPDGYILFYRSGDMHAARFDLTSMSVGNSFIVQPGIAAAGNGVGFDVASTGEVVYAPGSGFGTFQVVLKIENEQTDQTLGAAQGKEYSSPTFSPDGSRILLHVLEEASNDDIWLLDRDRGVMQRLTFDSYESEFPRWAPDGEHFYYTSHPSDSLSYAIRKKAGSLEESDTLYSSASHLHIDSISDDEQLIFFTVYRTFFTPDGDIRVLDVNTGKMTPLLQTRFNERQAVISPDGKWLAYESDEAGRADVYLRSFPEMGGQIKITTGGGMRPVWAKDGKALYFYQDGRINRVDMNDGRPGNVEVFKVLDRQHSATDTIYDVDASGSVIYVAHPGDSAFTGVIVALGFGNTLRESDPESR